MSERWMEQLGLKEDETATDKVVAIDIDRIRPNPFQPRKNINLEGIEELAQSIKSCGLIQPIVVRRSMDRYEIVVGERRYLACKKLGWKKMSASVQTLSDNAMATIALIENLQRENLNYFEEASGYVSLMKNFNLTQEVLAQRLGKKQSTIANKIRLLKLSAPVREKLVANGLTERHARALLKLDNEEKQLSMIQEIGERGLTVNQAEKRISKMIPDNKRKPGIKPAKTIVRDLRIVLNTIRKAVDLMNKSGLYPEVEETVEKDYIEVTIRLSKDMQKQER